MYQTIVALPPDDTIGADAGIGAGDGKEDAGKGRKAPFPRFSATLLGAMCSLVMDAYVGALTLAEAVETDTKGTEAGAGAGAGAGGDGAAGAAAGGGANVRSTSWAAVVGALRRLPIDMPLRRPHGGAGDVTPVAAAAAAADDDPYKDKTDTKDGKDGKEAEEEAPPAWARECPVVDRLIAYAVRAVLVPLTRPAHAPDGRVDVNVLALPAPDTASSSDDDDADGEAAVPAVAAADAVTAPLVMRLLHTYARLMEDLYDRCKHALPGGHGDWPGRWPRYRRLFFDTVQADLDGIIGLLDHPCLRDHACPSRTPGDVPDAVDAAVPRLLVQQLVRRVVVFVGMATARPAPGSSRVYAGPNIYAFGDVPALSDGAVAALVASCAATIEVMAAGRASHRNLTVPVETIIAAVCRHGANQTRIIRALGALAESFLPAVAAQLARIRDVADVEEAALTADAAPAPAPAAATAAAAAAAAAVAEAPGGGALQPPPPDGEIKLLAALRLLAVCAGAPSDSPTQVIFPLFPSLLLPHAAPSLTSSSFCTYVRRCRRRWRRRRGCWPCAAGRFGRPWTTAWTASEP